MDIRNNNRIFSVHLSLSILGINSTSPAPKTKCEKERNENIEKVKMLPDLFIPECSLYDGLYLEIQSGGMTGGKWCVDRYTGESIEGTYVPDGEGNPMCPGMLSHIG